MNWLIFNAESITDNIECWIPNELEVNQYSVPYWFVLLTSPNSISLVILAHQKDLFVFFLVHL